MFQFTTFTRRFGDFSDSDSDSDCEGDVEQHRFVKNYGMIENALEDETQHVERLMEWNQRLASDNQQLITNGTSIQHLLHTNQEKIVRSQKQNKRLIEMVADMQRQITELKERNQALSSKNVSLINELIDVEQKTEHKVAEIRGVLTDVHLDLVSGKESLGIADKIQRFAVRKAIEKHGYADSENEME